MRRQVKVKFLAVLLIALLVLAGCSSGGSGGSEKVNSNINTSDASKTLQDFEEAIYTDDVEKLSSIIEGEQIELTRDGITDKVNSQQFISEFKNNYDESIFNIINQKYSVDGEKVIMSAEIYDFVNNSSSVNANTNTEELKKYSLLLPDSNNILFNKNEMLYDQKHEGINFQITVPDGWRDKTINQYNFELYTAISDQIEGSLVFWLENGFDNYSDIDNFVSKLEEIISNNNSLIDNLTFNSQDATIKDFPHFLK